MTGKTKNWRNALLSPMATIHDAIRTLDEAAIQIVLVVGTDDVLEGTITDGDIRRGLLRGVGLDRPVQEIVQRDALVVPPEMSREMVLHMMRANKLRHIPVVDAQRRVVGLHLLDAIAIAEERDNVMIVMAGGMGTRLRPETEHCPKPLLPVAGKPMLEHILERAMSHGFRRFVFAINYLGHMIEEYFGDGAKWGVSIEYLREEKPLGTAGALGMLTAPSTDALVVTNGDVLTDLHYGDFLDFHVRHESAATMAVRPHEWQNPFGVVRIKGIDIVGFEEKPVTRSYVNAGVYALEPAALEVLERDEPCDMPALFMRLQDAGLRTTVYPMHEPWLDVGRPDDYASAQDINGKPNR